MFDLVILVDRLDKLPRASFAVAPLTELLRNPNASATDFEQVIKVDASLTATMLRAANTGQFRGAVEVRSVKEAIARLGMRNVHEIATQAAVVQPLPMNVPGIAFNVESMWKHSTAVAVLSEHIARKKQVIPSGVAYTAGLLHDVGKLVLAICLAEAKGGPVNTDVFSSVQTERETFGLDHADVGEEIALRWGFPRPVKEAARFHHDPNNVPEGSDRNSADLVHISNSMVHRMGLGGTPQDPNYAFSWEAMVRLNMKEVELKEIIEKSKAQITRAIQTTAAVASKEPVAAQAAR